MNYNVLEKERIMITNLLQNNDLISKLRLKPEYFYGEEHQSFIQFITENNEVDLKAIQHESINNQYFVSVDEIGKLYNNDSTAPAFFMQEQFEVLEEYKKRETNKLYKEFEGGNNTLDNLVIELETIRNLTINTGNENDSLLELLDEITSGIAPNLIKSGLRNIDLKTGGFEFGQFNIIAARPSVGKTGLALQMMYHMANEGYDVTFFSLETTRKNANRRLISMLQGIDLSRFKQPQNLTDDEIRKSYKGAQQIKDSGMKIIYNPTTKPSDVRLEAIQKSDKKKIIFIDFAQLMKADKSELGRTQELEQISRDLKRITTEYDVTIFLLAQINRGAESQQDKRPALSDIKGSGGFEQDANVAMLLHREDYYDEDMKQDNGNSTIEINIAKNKDGDTGTIELDYYKRTQKFYSAN